MPSAHQGHKDPRIHTLKYQNHFLTPSPSALLGGPWALHCLLLLLGGWLGAGWHLNDLGVRPCQRVERQCHAHAAAVSRMRRVAGRELFQDDHTLYHRFAGHLCTSNGMVAGMHLLTVKAAHNACEIAAYLLSDSVAGLCMSNSAWSPVTGDDSSCHSSNGHPPASIDGAAGPRLGTGHQRGASSMLVHLHNQAPQIPWRSDARPLETEWVA